MNSLGRKIEENEVVVIRAKLFKPEYQALEERVVRCQGGFGMNHETMGTAIACVHLSDGEETRWEGYNIDPEETKNFQDHYGKFGEQYVQGN